MRHLEAAAVGQFDDKGTKPVAQAFPDVIQIHACYMAQADAPRKPASLRR